ncbi:MAG TPA: HNH endonuclease [Magnetospirillum sp.]|nr:HNH endonuclease [Magnetospirillum sp.]
MPNDPWYKSPAWRAARAQRLALDRHTCTVPGCGRPAVVVDHTKPRSLAMSDLRSLCRLHDNQVKEDATGRRRSGGRFSVPGCDADGMPLDPNHPWRKA